MARLGWHGALGVDGSPHLQALLGVFFSCCSCHFPIKRGAGWHGLRDHSQEAPWGHALRPREAKGWRDCEVVQPELSRDSSLDARSLSPPSRTQLSPEPGAPFPTSCFAKGSLWTCIYISIRLLSKPDMFRSLWSRLNACFLCSTAHCSESAKILVPRPTQPGRSDTSTESAVAPACFAEKLGLTAWVSGNSLAGLLFGFSWIFCLV